MEPPLLLYEGDAVEPPPVVAVLELGLERDPELRDVHEPLLELEDPTLGRLREPLSDGRL